MPKILLLVMAAFVILTVTIWVRSSAGAHQPIQTVTTEIPPTSQDLNYEESNIVTEQVVLDDCSQEVPVGWIDDISFGGDGTAHMYWLDYVTQENEVRHFPFDPESDFAGCSESVKTELRELARVVKEHGEKERVDMCIDLTETLAGKREMRAKNGEMPNVESMKEYVEKNCK